MTKTDEYNSGYARGKEDAAKVADEFRMKVDGRSSELIDGTAEGIGRDIRALPIPPASDALREALEEIAGRDLLEIVSMHEAIPKRSGFQNAQEFQVIAQKALAQAKPPTSDTCSTCGATDKDQFSICSNGFHAPDQSDALREALTPKQRI